MAANTVTMDASPAEGPVRTTPGPAPRRPRGSRIKNALCWLYLYSGYVAARDFILGLLGRSRAVVLYYHRVGFRDVLSTPTEEFREELRYLKKHYECLSLEELCRRLRDRQPLSRRIAVVTFDDGYRDNLTEAAPVLQELDVPATIFVATGFIGTDRVFPHDARAAERSGTTAHFPKLTWDDLRELQAQGVEIGSHTVEHTDLGKVDAATLNHELRSSLASLRAELGDRPRAFSFPWGKPENFTAEALQAVQDVGYYAAVTAYGGVNTPGGWLFRLQRVDVGNGNLSPLTVRARIAGFDPDYWRLCFGRSWLGRILKRK